MLIGIIIAVALVLIFLWFKQGIYEFITWRKPQHGSWIPYTPPGAIGKQLLKYDVTGNVGFDIYNQMDTLSGYIDYYYEWVVNKYRIPKFVQNIMPLPDSDPSSTNRNEFIIQTGLKLDFINDLVPAYKILAETIMKSPNFTLSPQHLENYWMFNPWDDRWNFWIALSIMVRFRPTRLVGTAYQGLLTVSKNSGFADSNLIYNFLCDTDDKHTRQRMQPIADWLGLDFSSYVPGNPTLPTDPDHNNAIYAAACDWWSKIVDKANADNFTIYGINLKGIAVIFDLDKCDLYNGYQCTLDNVKLYPQRQNLKSIMDTQNYMTVQWGPTVYANLYNMPEANDFCAGASDFLNDCHDTEKYMDLCGHLEFDIAECATTNKKLVAQWQNAPRSFNEYLETSGREGVEAQLFYDDYMATYCDPTMAAVAQCGSNIINSDCGSIVPSKTCTEAGIKLDGAMYASGGAAEQYNANYIPPPYGVDDVLKYCDLQSTLDNDGQPCTNLNPLHLDCSNADAMDALDQINRMHWQAGMQDRIVGFNNIATGGQATDQYKMICNAINAFDDEYGPDNPARQNQQIEKVFEDMNCYSDTCIDWWMDNLNTIINYRDGSPGLYPISGGNIDPELAIELNRADYCDVWYQGWKQCGFGHESDFQSRNVCQNNDGTCMRHKANMDYAMRQWVTGTLVGDPDIGGKYQYAAELYCSNYNDSVAAGCNPGPAAIDCTVPDFTGYMHAYPPPTNPQPVHPTSIDTWLNITTDSNGVQNGWNPSPYLSSSIKPLSLTYDINNDPFRKWVGLYDWAKAQWNTSNPALDATEAQMKQWIALEDLDIIRGHEVGDYYYGLLQDYQDMMNMRKTGLQPGVADFIQRPNDGGIHYDQAILTGSCAHYAQVYKPTWGTLPEYEGPDCDPNAPSLPHLQYMHYGYLSDQFNFNNSGGNQPPYNSPETPNGSLDALCAYYTTYKAANGTVYGVEQDCANAECIKGNNNMLKLYAQATNTNVNWGTKPGWDLLDTVQFDQGWTANGDSWDDDVAPTIEALCQAYGDAQTCGTILYSIPTLDQMCPTIDQTVDLHQVNVARGQYQLAQNTPNTSTAAPFQNYVNAYQTYRTTYGAMEPYETETANAACTEAGLLITGVYNWNGRQYNRVLDDMNNALTLGAAVAPSYNEGNDQFDSDMWSANYFLDAYQNHYIPACGHNADYDALVNQYNQYEAQHALYKQYLGGQTGGAWASQLATQNTDVANQYLQNMPAVCNTYTTQYKPTYGPDNTFEQVCATWQHDGTYALIQSQYNDWLKSSAMVGGVTSADTPVQTYFTKYKPIWGSDSTFDQMTQNIKNSNLINYKTGGGYGYTDAIREYNQAQNSSTVTKPGDPESDYDLHMQNFIFSFQRYWPYYQQNIVPYGITDSDSENYYKSWQCYNDQKNIANFKAQYDSTYNSKYAPAVAAGQYTQKQANLYYMMPILKQMCPPYRDYKTRACSPTLDQDSWYDQQCSSVGL